MTKPIISERFDLEDIRAVRDYNSARHLEMTHAEIMAEEEEAYVRFMAEMQRVKKSA